MAELKIKRWRRFCQVGRRHYSSFQKREREFCGFLTKYVKYKYWLISICQEESMWGSRRFLIEWSWQTLRLTPGLIALFICAFAPIYPLNLLCPFLLTISAFFLENWWWSFVERDPTWTWWQRANGGLSWRRDRPQSARRHLRSCCSWWVKDRMSSAETEEEKNLSQDTVWCGERWVTRHSSSATLPASTWNSSSSSSLW